MRSVAPAPLEDHHHDAVRRADAQQVHAAAALSGTSTERNTSVSSRNDSSTTARDEHRQPLADPVADVGEGRGLPADVSLRRAVREHVREAPAVRSRSIVVEGGVVLRAPWSGTRPGSRRPPSALDLGSRATDAMPASAATASAQRARRRPGPRRCRRRSRAARWRRGRSPSATQVVGAALGAAVRERPVVGEAQRAARAPVRRAASSSAVHRRWRSAIACRETCSPQRTQRRARGAVGGARPVAGRGR